MKAPAHESRNRGREELRRSPRAYGLLAVVALLFLSSIYAPADVTSDGATPAGMAPVGVTPVGVAPERASVVRNRTVKSLIDRVTRAELEPVVRDLSGERPCTVGGLPYTFRTRHSGSGEPIDKAEQYVYEKLDSYGLDSVSYHAFTVGAGGRNVVGEIRGSSPKRADQIVIVGAHLDAKAPRSPSGSPVPGADDDASGISAMLFVARALAGEEFGRTIRFVAFGDEEWGFAGSSAYAKYCRRRGEDVVAMVQADMLAYANGSGDVELRVRPADKDPGLGDRRIARTYADVLHTYGIALDPVIRNADGAQSDNESFWSRGYHAMLLIEGLTPTNPYYHSSRDRVSTFNWNYYVRTTRGLTGQIAHLARIDTIGPVIASVTSTTHPVARGWYPVTVASLRWKGSDAQTGVSGYSYVVDQSANTVVDTTSEGVGTSYVSGDLPQGVSYLHVRARDGAGNWGATVHRAVRVDTVAPTTTAPYPASVLRGRIATLSYEIADAAPNGGTADVTIRVKTPEGQTVAKLVLPDRAVNIAATAKFRCLLARGSYTFFVSAADAAGNRQAEVGSNVLVVR